MYKKLFILAFAFSLFLTTSVQAANIIWITQSVDLDENGIQDDQEWIDWLVAQGYTVDVQFGHWTELDAGKIQALNAADLVIISRTIASGDYNEDDEPTQWNSITAPMIQLSAWLIRNSRWLWFDSSDVQRSLISTLEVLVSDHPIFTRVTLNTNNQVEIMIPDIYGEGYRGNCFINTLNVGNGTLIGQTAGADMT